MGSLALGPPARDNDGSWQGFSIARDAVHEDRHRRLHELVALLDDAAADEADTAQFVLIEDFRADALEPLIEAAPRFSDYGRLCAIEVFQSIGDRRAGRS